jgi:hypothetical protein
MIRIISRKINTTPVVFFYNLEYFKEIFPEKQIH